MICTAHQILFGVKIENNEMGGACSTCGEQRNLCRFFVGKTEKIDHWGDPGIDKKIILRWIFRKWDVVL